MANAQRLVDNGDGTLTDHTTELMWQKEDDAKERNWEDACAYCQALTVGGFYDWRLPGLDEFRSLVEAAKASGVTVNGTYNRSSNADYWTGTRGPQSSVAYIADGTTMFLTNQYCVRGVRSMK